MAKKLLGIDIGDYRIKFALCENGRVKTFTSTTVPDNLVRDGRITAFHAMADFLKETVKANKLRRRKAAVVLPESAYFIRRVRVPLMTVQQLAVNLPYELHDYITGEVSSYVFDYSIISIGEKDMELMIAACSKETVANYREMCAKAGLTLVKLVPDVVALETIVGGEEKLQKAIAKDAKELKKVNKPKKKKKEKVEEPEQEEETIPIPYQIPTPPPQPAPAPEEPVHRDFAVLDLGHSGTRLHFFAAETYEITRTLNTGAREIVNILSQEEGIDPHVAQLYIESNHDECLSHQRISDELDSLTMEIMRVMNFYNYNNPRNTIEKIYYMGSGIPAEALLERVEEATGLKMEPLSDLLPEGAQVDTIGDGPQTFGAVMAPQASAINLFIVEKHTKQNLIAIGLFMVYLVLLGLFTKYMIIDQLAVIDRMERAYQDRQQTLEDIKNENSIYEEVRAEYSHYGNGYLNDEERALEDRMEILKVIEEQLLSKDALQNIAITDNVATLTINSEKLANVSQIVASLEDYPIVEYVTVSNSATNERYIGQEEKTSGVVTTMTIFFRDANAEEETQTTGEGQ